MIFGEVLESRAGPAEQATNTDARRQVILAERVKRERFLENRVREEHAEVTACRDPTCDRRLCGGGCREDTAEDNRETDQLS